MIGAINKNSGEYTLPIDGCKNDNYICIECGEEVVFKNGKIRKAHFAHRHDNTCEFLSTGESIIHKNAKLLVKYALLKFNEINVVQKCECGIIINTKKIVMQHDDNICIEYSFKFNGVQKYADIAHIDVNGNVKNIFEICHTHKTNEMDRPEPWYEFNANDIVSMNFKYSDNVFRCIRNVVCGECKQKHNYVNDERIVSSGNIYINQRGAGCGKTFESIQLLLRDEKFKEKRTFIYLTKMHSAKDVILSELQNQEKNGLLKDIKLVYCKMGSSKQYKINFFDKINDDEITILIGTIDSFNYAMVNKEKIEREYDYFKSIVNTLKNGNFDNKIIHHKSLAYGRNLSDIDNSCLVILDEAQDLEKEYIEAFDKIVNEMCIDVYVIGDKLQSIWSDENIYTYIESSNLGNIIRSNGINKVMRFHNNNFVGFVNNIVPFEKYGLPKISGICDRKDCKHNDNIIPHNVFEISNIFAKNVGPCVKKIIEMIDYEVNEYNYTPDDFMIIFPVLKNNTLSVILHERIQMYWINKMNDKEYQKNISNNVYWTDHINNNLESEYHQYVFLHKSEEGRSINLKESDKATRILSIHSSKGNGSNVVFVLGLSEDNLKIFSKKCGNLVYESLLHVSLTRQKRSLYVGIEKSNNDIYRRFSKFTEVQNNDMLKPNLKSFTKYNRNIHFKTYIENNQNIFKKYKDQLSCLDTYIPNDVDQTDIVEWGHHVIRYASMYVYILFNICMNSKNKHIEALLWTFLNFEIKAVEYVEYNSILCKFSECKNLLSDDILNESEKIIPLLIFNKGTSNKYNKYIEYIIKIGNNLKDKIKEYMNVRDKITLCPIENLLLTYWIHTKSMGRNNTVFTIMDLYDIIYYFDMSNDNGLLDHNDNCICQHVFEYNKNNKHIKNKDIANSVRNHYKNLNKLENMCNQYKEYIESNNVNEIGYIINRNVYYEYLPSDIIMQDESSIYGYSEDTIVNIIIKPTFNELNAFDVFTSIMLKNHIMCKENENIKNIIACLITCDSTEPIFINIDINNELREKIDSDFRNYIYDKYLSNHNMIYKYYVYCKKNKPKDMNSILYTIEMIHKNDKLTKLPGYVTVFFNDLLKMAKNKHKKDELMNILNNENVFLEMLDEYLNDMLDIAFSSIRLQDDDFDF